MLISITLIYLFTSLIILSIGLFFLPKLEKKASTIISFKKTTKPKARLFSFLPKKKSPPTPYYLKIIKYGFYCSTISAILLIINYKPVSYEDLNTITTIQELSKVDPFADAYTLLMIPMTITGLVNLFSLFWVILKFFEFGIIIGVAKLLSYIWSKIKQFYFCLRNKPNQPSQP